MHELAGYACGGAPSPEFAGNGTANTRTLCLPTSALCFATFFFTKRGKHGQWTNQLQLFRHAPQKFTKYKRFCVYFNFGFISYPLFKVSKKNSPFGICTVQYTHVVTFFKKISRACMYPSTATCTKIYTNNNLSHLI